MVILTAVGGEQGKDRTVDVGQDLATAYDDDLVVLHVMEQDKFDKLHGDSQVTGSSTPIAPGAGSGELTYVSSQQEIGEYHIKDAVADAEKIADECVARTLSGADLTHVETRGRVGDPATQILAEAESLDARYLIVGGRKRSPTGKAIFGSVSQSVILESDRPVVTITQSG
jgi:nucleotide-binding universal stress UspA family protein